MDRTLESFRHFKRAKGQGSHPTSTYTSGRSTPDPGSSGQPTVDPYFGDRSTPRTSGHSTACASPSIQRTVGPRVDDQSTGNSWVLFKSTYGRPPVPRSSGQPIDSGIYTITNVPYSRFVYLEDANDDTPLRGHSRPGNRNAQWHVKSWGNEKYSIENVEHSRYAYCGSLIARLKAPVEGNNTEQLWRIRARPTGEYTIATADTRNLWMLPSDIADTPVELSNVYTDLRCWWTFTPVDEKPASQPIFSYPTPRSSGQRIPNPASQPIFSYPTPRSSGQRIPNPASQPIFSYPTPHSSGQRIPNPASQPIFSYPTPRSSGQPIPNAAIVGFTYVITEATGILWPLGAACKALRVVLQRAENIGHVNEDREALIKRLKFHLATVENHIAKLEEDQRIDEIIPALNQDVREALVTYARELKEIYEMLSGNQSKDSSLVNEVTSQTRKIDEVFQIYTAALHLFVANTVAQMPQQLAQFRQEFQQGAHTAAEKARPNRPNAYGIQKCLQGTREKTLPAISDWVDDKNTKKWIFFFLDVAGSGKSTVAKHMAEKWKGEDRLLAQFFFSRDTTETMSTNSFCSTVAGAFAALDPKYRKHMDKFMRVPKVELLPFEERFKGLVARPLRAIGRRAILIIDALDECDAKQRNELLETLRDQHNSIPLLRILATGRPERNIKHWAEEEFRFGYMNFTRLGESDKDVELYIKHRLRDVPEIQDRLYPVIRHAEGLFIWARIACDLLLDSDNIEGLLDELGKHVSLDYLYKVALERSTPREEAYRRAVVLVLQMILAAKEPLSIAELDILSPKRGVVERTVTRLSSVLLYHDREDPIRLLHPTFREFLTTRSAANIFFIQPELGHHTLASGCLKTISYLSKQDDTTLRNVDMISNRKLILYYDKILIDSVPRTFIYSSTSWVHHCSLSYRKLALNKQILEFANGGLKTWIYLVGNWRGLDTQACISSVSLLSRRNMSPEITEALVSQSLEATSTHFELKAISPEPDAITPPPNKSFSVTDHRGDIKVRPWLDSLSTPFRATPVQEIFDKLYYRPNASTLQVEIQAVGQDVPAKRLLPFLTIPYVCAQRILYIAREVEVFNMQSICIARQALNLVLLLNDFVTTEQAPDDEQRHERIHLGDDLLSLEQSMKKWGAAAGVHEEYEERASEIGRQYDAFFKERFYYQSARGGLNDRTFQNLLDYDKSTIKREQWSPTTEREG